MFEWQACEIMAELVEGMQSVFALGHHRNHVFPAFLTPTLRNIIISLSRLPLVNSYTRVPPLVSVCEGCSALTLCTRIHLSIKRLVCRFGNWGGPLSREETTALHCQRFLWTSCRKKMSSESSCTASTRSVHNHTQIHNPSNRLSLCLMCLSECH